MRRGGRGARDSDQIEPLAADVTFAPGQILKTDKTVYTEGEDIVVQFKGFPGNQDDWITIVPAGSPDTTLCEYLYLGGRASGTISFDGRPRGEYEVRGYFDCIKIECTVHARYPIRVEGS